MAKGDFGNKRNTAGFDKHPENINKKGAPLGIKEAVRNILYENDSIKLNEIITALYEKAKTGDVRAAQELFDRAFNKSTNIVEAKVETKPIEYKNVSNQFKNEQ